jgi:tetratricopeptide (TPR) repeat protein
MIQKNIVYGTIHANGNVHIGDVVNNYYATYNIAQDFRAGSILFLRLKKTDETHCEAQLSVKSRHSTQGKLATLGEKWCENIEIAIPPELYEQLADFQALRRGVDTPFRHRGSIVLNNASVQAAELQLAQLIFQTFFSGEIGHVCRQFIQLLEEQRIEELLLAISTDDETLVNLPFEMALPLLFPSRLGETQKHLSNKNFGLVRTSVQSLDAFSMQGRSATAAPLKMLFITALPENLDEKGKMLQIEEEQTRLIQAIGALEATGDQRPKIVIEFLENASLAELDKALRARQHNIVHVSGHGAYHAAEDKGVLYFENENGDEEQVTGKALGETLGHHACVKLLILSACETAIAGSEGGVTEQAAEYVPSVVAMRFAVTDEGAKLFTTEFYTQLAKGLSLTRALAYAREALHLDMEQRREQAPQITCMAEWFTPVVYQNQAMGALIDQALPYYLPDHFYPSSSFLKTKQSRLIGEGFIGRKHYLIQLRQAFRAGRHVCLHGLGGLGKTTLAEAFAHNYDNHSHATVIFRNGHQINEAHILQTFNKRFAKINPDLAEQLQQVLDDPQTEVLDKLQHLIDNYLKGRKTILIFDNVEDVQKTEGSEHDYQRSIGSPGLSAFLRHLCENTPPNCHILFTTRYKIEDLTAVVEHLPLDKMGYAEQYRLLNYSLTLRGIPLRHRDDVYRRLDGHPRGYEYLEALLKKDPTFSWEQVSQSEEKIFENLLLAKVYERLSEREKALFQMVSVFIARTPLEALEYVNDKEAKQKGKKGWLKSLFSKPKQIEKEVGLLEVLQSLHDWSLCFLEKDGRFEVHRLTRAWMGKNVIPVEKTKEWAFTAGKYFLEKDEVSADDGELARDYFETAEAWEDFADISFRLQNHYEMIGLNQRVIELNQAVLEKNINEKRNSHALSNIAYLFLKTGNYGKALPIFEQSLEFCRKTGDRLGEGATLNNISQIHTVKGDYDTALQYLEQSLAISQQIGDRQGEGATLNNISQIHKVKGDYDTALRYLEQSLAIRQQIGDRQGEGATLNNISQIHKVKGDYDTALRYLEQSLAIQQQIGDRLGEGVTLNNISQIHKVKGDYDTALRYLEQSLAISQQIGDRKGEGVTLNNISQIYDSKGDYDTALRYLEQSLAIMQQIGDRLGEGVTLNNISQIHKVKGDYDTALRYLEQSLAISQEIGDLQGESVTLNNISSILYIKGHIEEAMAYSYRDLQICQEIGDINGMATTMNNMGSRYFDQEKYEEAVPLLMQAYQIRQKIGSPAANDTAGYLNAIIERIGEAKFQAILSSME